MKWKNRLTNYNFWISIVSAVLLILQAFEFQFDIAYINEIATAVLGLLVVIGIISDPTKTYSNSATTTQTETQEIEKTEKKEQHTIKLPTEVETEADADHAEDDFKAIMNKISEDIEERLAQISQLQSSIINEINLKKENHETNTDLNANTEQEIENPTCFNIVNN